MIKEEEYEVIGYIKKICVCDKCMVEMTKGNFLPSEPPKYEMHCPKCGKMEYADYSTLQNEMKIKKKVID